MRGYAVEEREYLKYLLGHKDPAIHNQKWYDKRKAKRKAQRLARRKNRK